MSKNRTFQRVKNQPPAPAVPERISTDDAQHWQWLQEQEKAALAALQARGCWLQYLGQKYGFKHGDQLTPDGEIVRGPQPPAGAAESGAPAA